MMINTQSNFDMKHCLVLGISQRKKSIYFIGPIIGLVLWHGDRQKYFGGFYGALVGGEN